jgi:N-acetylglutamate synthase-like GNAT family acetyltransferase
MKDLFNERIPNIPSNDIDTMMKNSIQFICQQDTTFCVGAIVKEDNNLLCLVLIAVKKQKRRIGEKLLSSIFNHYDKSSMEIYVHANRRSKGFYLKQGFKDRLHNSQKKQRPSKNYNDDATDKYSCWI